MFMFFDVLPSWILSQFRILLNLRLRNREQIVFVIPTATDLDGYKSGRYL